MGIVLRDLLLLGILDRPISPVQVHSELHPSDNSASAGLQRCLKKRTSSTGRTNPPASLSANNPPSATSSPTSLVQSSQRKRVATTSTSAMRVHGLTEL